MKYLAVAMVSIMLVSMLGLAVPKLQNFDANDATKTGSLEALGFDQNTTNRSFPNYEKASTLFPLYHINQSAVGDYNEDGYMDVAFMSYTSSKITLFLNNNGTFSTVPSKVLGVGNANLHPVGISMGRGIIAVAYHNTSAGEFSSDDKVYVWIKGKESFSLSHLSSGNITAVALGDFNGDGKVDVAAAYQISTTQSEIDVYFGDLSANQNPNSTTQINTPVNILVAGDINKDGHTDLAYAERGSNKAHVLIAKRSGTSSGLFKNPVDIPASSVSALAIANVTSTPYPDLIVANNDTGNVSIFQGNSGGIEIGNYFNISAGAGVQSIAVGDFNGDGINDTAVGYAPKNLSGILIPREISIFRGPLYSKERPEYRVYAGINTVSLGAADFNNDGKDDLVACAAGIPNSKRSEAYILYQENGKLHSIADTELFLGTKPDDVLVTDINGDGINDLVIEDKDSKTVYALLNNNGEFVISNKLTISSVPMFLASGTIDNEKFIAISHEYDGNITLWYQNGSLEQINTTLNGTGKLWVGDINGDGYDDIVALGFDSNGKSKVAIFSGKNITQGAKPTHIIGVPGSAKDFTMVKNITGMYYLAVGVWNSLSSRYPVYFYYNLLSNSPPQSLGNGSVDNNITSMVSVDINHDGNQDILVAANKSYYTYLYWIELANGNYFEKSENLSFGFFGRVYDMKTGDFNDDGITDVAMANTLGMVSILYFNSTGNFTCENMSSDWNSHHLATGDLNGDGKTDIVITSWGPVAEHRSLKGIDIYYQRDFPPVAKITAPKIVMERSNITLSGANSTDGVSDRNNLNYTWYLLNGGRKVIGYGKKLTYYVGNVNESTNYTFGLKVTDKEGLSNETTAVVRVIDSVPIVNFTYKNAVEGRNTTFIANITSEDGISKILWDFNGDGIWDFVGNASNGTVVNYTYLKNGTYNVILNVTDGDGSNSSVTKTILVKDTSPVCDFTYTPNLPVEGEKVYFNSTITSYDPVVNITWTINLAKTNIHFYTRNITYVFEQQGDYNVSLAVTDSDGSVSTVTKRIMVKDTSPTANFTYYPLIPYEGQIVYLNASATAYDGIKNYTWLVNNITMYGQNVTYVFPQQGNYTVILNVEDSDGSTTEVTKTIKVLDTVPEANFTWSGKYEGQTYQFNVTVKSYDPIVSYYWDFGDGGHSKIKNATHVFKNQGNYTVILYVEDSDGSNMSFQNVVRVLDSKPRVYFNFSNAIEGQPVHFNATIISYDGIANITWEFGDGSLEYNTINPEHIYRENGIYTVNLTVREKDGDENTSSRAIYVKDTVPIVKLKIDGNSTVKEDENVEFNASGTTAYDKIVAYYWDFDYNGSFAGDEKTNKPFANHSFAEEGHYIVKLMVVDSDGSGSYAQVVVTVNNVPPRANFEYTINDNEVRFDASSTYDTPSDKKILNYTWDFGDGTSGYGMKITHTYSKPGTYNVTLTVRDNDGAISKFTRTVHITKVISPLPYKSGNPWPWILLALALGTIGAFVGYLIVNKRKYTVDDVYLIDQSGILIHHATRRLKPEMDEDILSSMLVAVQEFIKDAFKGEENVALKSMDFGDKKIQIHKGKKLFLAIVSSNKIPASMEKKARAVLEEIEEKYADALENWNGDVSQFRGVGTILKKIWE